jgi:GH24 family phage-related lysozyme (muramidase)
MFFAIIKYIKHKKDIKMTKKLTVNRGDEKEVFTIYVNGVDVAVKPYNMNIEDAVLDMMYDIGEFNWEYLKEVLREDYSLYPKNI